MAGSLVKHDKNYSDTYEYLSMQTFIHSYLLSIQTCLPDNPSDVLDRKYNDMSDCFSAKINQYPHDFSIQFYSIFIEYHKNVTLFISFLRNHVVCVCVCVRVCVRACVRVCVRACVCDVL